MTKLSIQKYMEHIEETELSLISCNDKTKILSSYLELIQFQINHSYILSELPYFYIRCLYDWINSSIIYAEYCLSIEISRACTRLLYIKDQIIEFINKIIEITSSDYDNLCKINDLLIIAKELLENLHPSLITTPNTRNNIHLHTLSVLSNYQRDNQNI
jgi:hypothetical protein